ncbi:MAG: hypothetical protein ACR2JF_03435 [Iamia sp.]
MDRAEAARVLGVAIDASPAAVRGAFRDLIRQHHPDRGGAAGGEVAARLIEAHRVLRDTAPPSARAVPSPPPPSPAPAATPVDARAEGDALFVRADPDTVLARLVEAAHQLGEVTYLDRGAGLVEVLVLVQDREGDRPAACSLVASLQGRLDAVEVFCTVERLDGHAGPPVAPLVAALAEALQRG